MSCLKKDKCGLEIYIYMKKNILLKYILEATSNRNLSISGGEMLHVLVEFPFSTIAARSL